MSGAPRCPQCGYPVRPGAGLLVGAWYCDHCNRALLDETVVKDNDEKLPDNVVRGPWRP